ncbi:uncharacterized protein BYT42DRAFT_324747 [Radiomyces spectabilis]|uniref:uncharacterized protein n=1 Tax=Radiomyces spectabilis TaxID=64574 RepID=UPI00221EAF11|nr:uncharacterized protein BYT42DRAFT_324747 [Radiomyces spectabilis]KAI8379389.1 hypothetical protein BYT42DRAFT_324747 [Radiomyces spectabilis]
MVSVSVMHGKQFPYFMVVQVSSSCIREWLSEFRAAFQGSHRWAGGADFPKLQCYSTMAKSPQDYKKTSQQFHSQLEHLHRLLYSTKPCPSTATAIIKSINDAETPYKAVTDQQIIDIFVTGCKALKYTDDACPPFLKFMFKQSSKHIRITKLRSAQLETCVTFILDGLDTDIDAELRVDLLRAFSALLFENAANTAKFYPRIAKTLLRAADRSTTPLEVRRMAINCIGNTCAGAGSKLQPYYSDYYEVLLSNICAVDHTSRGTMMVASTSLDFADPAVRKVASSTLRALQFVLGQDKSLVTNPLCDIIDIIHTFIFMHVSVQSYNSILAAMKDIELTSTASSPHRLARIRGVISPPRSHSWRPNMHKFVSATSSDSELSDSDPVNLNPRRQRDDAKIRINALLCLAAVAKTSSRALYPHWQRFIPDSFTIFLSNNTDPLSAAKQPLHLSPVLRSDNQPFSLFTILLYDPMPTVRTAACNVLLSMFDGAKQYLSVASESDAKTSFTSLSGKLASILRDCHQGLICVIEREQDPRILGLVMKVACTLVANCTYDRLATGYLSRLYHTVLKRWHSASLEIRSSILQVISAILEAFSGHQEVAALVEQPIDENDISVDNLVVFFLVSIAAKEAVTDANGYKIELWHTFATLAKTHFATVWHGRILAIFLKKS